MAQDVIAAAGSQSPAPKSRLRRFVRHWVVPFAIAAAVLVPIRSAVADWNDVPTGSMEPTILPGDRIFVNKLAYGLRIPLTNTWVASWGGPQAGEVVVFHSPADGTRLVKRVIAGPGDTVEMRDDHLIINGVSLNYFPAAEADLQTVSADHRKGQIFASEQLNGRSHLVAATPGRGALRTFGPVTVPEGHYFMMGDNRDNSHDSRFFGPVARRLIVGRSSAVAISVDPDRMYMPRLDRCLSGLR